MQRRSIAQPRAFGQIATTDEGLKDCFIASLANSFNDGMDE
jgi:hypothetical protein